MSSLPKVVICGTGFLGDYIVQAPLFHFRVITTKGSTSLNKLLKVISRPAVFNYLLGTPKENWTLSSRIAEFQKNDFFLSYPSMLSIGEH